MNRNLLERKNECACDRSHEDQSAASIVDAIECITTVPTESIVVTVQGDWVRLQGTLMEQHQRETVGDVVQHLTGVRGVTNSITIEPRALVGSVT